MSAYPIKIQRIIDEGYDFRIGKYLNKGFNLMLKNPGGFIGFYLLLFVFSLLAIFIPFIGPLGMFVITPALNIGPLYVAYKTDRGEATQFSDFFRGFDKFGELFVTELLIKLLNVAVMLPGYFLLFATLLTSFISSGPIDPYSDPSDMLSTFSAIFGSGLAITGIFLIIIPLIYMLISFYWANLLVWFYDMRAWDAMMASRKLIARQFWVILVFGFLASLITVTGFFAIGIGILFTLPAMVCANYAAFADVTRLDEEEPEPDVLDSFAPLSDLDLNLP